jgi:UDP-glucose 4-epimerase
MYKKALVTGGFGLIGSHLVERLVEQAEEVLILDDSSTGQQRHLNSVLKLSKVGILNGSIADRELVKSAMDGADVCFHLAASLGVNRILRDPLVSYSTNVHGTENVVSLASENGTKVFLASTSEIYGKNPEQPLTETSDRVLGSPLNIRWAYSEAKALDESLLQMYRQEQGLNYVIARFFNTVGPRQTGSYGMVLPRFVKAAINGEPIEVYGNGDQTRVFCHVKDAVDAVLALIDNDKAEGEVFNVGGEGEVSMNDLANKVKEISGSKSPISHVPYSEAYPAGFEETFRRVPDTKKLRDLTGWKPKFSLDQIINDVIEYQRAIG